MDWVYDLDIDEEKEEADLLPLREEQLEKIYASRANNDFSSFTALENELLDKVVEMIEAAISERSGNKKSLQYYLENTEELCRIFLQQLQAESRVLESFGRDELISVIYLSFYNAVPVRFVTNRELAIKAFQPIFENSALWVLCKDHLLTSSFDEISSDMAFYLFSMWRTEPHLYTEHTAKFLTIFLVEGGVMACELIESLIRLIPSCNAETVRKMAEQNQEKLLFEGLHCPYDGVDARQKEPYCFSCCKDYVDRSFRHSDPQPTKAVSRCSACKVAFYCSSECQKKGRRNHKNMCNMFKTQRKLVADSQVGNRRVGHCQITDPLVKSKFDLALILYTPAHDCFGSWIWKEAANHLQECQRLCHLNYEGDDLGLRNKFPMFLLYADRDDDAYSYVRYKIHRDHVANHSETTVIFDRFHEGSKEGDWIYPREDGCRFDNILEEFSEEELREAANYNLLVLWIIKMKIVATFVERETLWNCFLTTETVELLPNDVCKDKIFIYLLGNAAFRAKRHAQLQLERVADVLDDKIPSLLPAILNPEPLCSRVSMFYTPDAIDAGSLIEARHILNDCFRHVRGLPAYQLWWLQRRYGIEPDFHLDDPV